MVQFRIDLIGPKGAVFGAGGRVMSLLRDVFTPVFIARLLIGIVVGGGTAWGVSFLVADYVVTRSIPGLTTSVQGVQGIVNTINANSAQMSAMLVTEIRALSAERDDIANAIAEKVTQTLARDVQAMDQRLTESVKRQISFEQIVSSYLFSQGRPNLKDKWN
jgi:hypothetical protein